MKSLLRKRYDIWNLFPNIAITEQLSCYCVSIIKVSIDWDLVDGNMQVFFFLYLPFLVFSFILNSHFTRKLQEEMIVWGSTRCGVILAFYSRVMDMS